MRLVAAMSGGVDSAVATAQVVEQGHEVVGVHLALTAAAASATRVHPRGCCSLEDSGDARRVADRLGIPFYIWDLAQEFQRDVIDDFVAEYRAGRTPNPCLRCNERIKFAGLLDRALALGFDGVVTGHYARIVEADQAVSGHRELHRAIDTAKDQSYVLGVLDAQQLAASWFPLGEFTKPQVRQLAGELGFSVASKPDSHDICFVTDGDTRAWLTAELGAAPGKIVDEAGQVVGEHEGAFAYTVGQRRGLQLRRPAADGRPRYVVGTDPISNTVLVGPHELLGIDELTGHDARWCGPPPLGEQPFGVQLRAHGQEIPALVTAVNENRVEVRLRERTRGVAPGQAVVIYEGTRVVGSATIAATSRR